MIIMMQLVFIVINNQNESSKFEIEAMQCNAMRCFVRNPRQWNSQLSLSQSVARMSLSPFQWNGISLK